MDFSNFNVVLPWLIANGYWLIFLAMCIEGPIVVAAASFACALGVFNPTIIFVLAFFGDVLPDALYYGIGFWGRESVVDKFGRYFGLTSERIKKIEELGKQHLIKTLLAIKLTPLAPLPGIMAIGAIKASFKKFLAIISIFTIPKVIIFMIIGYYFGEMYDKVFKYIEQGGVILAALSGIVIVISLLYDRIAALIAKQIEKF
jgi:membrane protein DedA with SNARE-associated domain